MTNDPREKLALAERELEKLTSRCELLERAAGQHDVEFARLTEQLDEAKVALAAYLTRTPWRMGDGSTSTGVCTLCAATARMDGVDPTCGCATARKLTMGVGA